MKMLEIVIFLKWVTEFTVKCFSKFVISSCHRTWFIKHLLMKLPFLPKQSWFGVISSVIKKVNCSQEREEITASVEQRKSEAYLFLVWTGSCTFNCFKLIHFILFFKVWTYVSSCVCVRDNLVIVTLKYKLPMQYVLN